MGTTLGFMAIDKALRRARDCFMDETVEAINKSGATYEEAAVYRSFAESICVAYETYAIRELKIEFDKEKGVA